MHNPKEQDVRIELRASQILYYCRLPLGPTTNKMYMPVATRGKSRFVRTREYKAWQNMVDMIDTMEGNKPAALPIGSIENPVGVVIVVHGSDVDTDNCAKAHIDYLVRNGILSDDDISIAPFVFLMAGKPLNKRQYAEIIVYPATEFGLMPRNQKTIEFKVENDGHGRDVFGA